MVPQEYVHEQEQDSPRRAGHHRPGVVYTREFGEKYEFALEKNEIESVDYDGGMRVTIHAKDGSAYSFNTSPAKDTLDALEQLGVPVAR